MAGERSYPILPCADLDGTVAFYESSGFTCTYRQYRPNPYAVVGRGELELHLCGIDGFDPANSYGSAIITVPDLDSWYADIVERLRAEFGRVPVSGIPRVLRPRKRQGTVRGFTMIDPGGNWLRFSQAGDSEDTQGASTGLERVIENAARLADAKGDDAHGRRVVRAGLRRYPDADPGLLVRAWAFLAELETRLGNTVEAHRALDEAAAADPDPADAQAISDLAHAREVVSAID
jgi:hypothetical protein